MSGTCARHIGEPLHLYVLGSADLPLVMEACRVCDREAMDEECGRYGQPDPYFLDGAA